MKWLSRLFQERDIRQLLLEVKALEQSTSAASSETCDDEDGPQLAALKLQNSKLKYRIIHLQKVLIFLIILTGAPTWDARVLCHIRCGLYFTFSWSQSWLLTTLSSGSGSSVAKEVACPILFSNLTPFDWKVTSLRPKINPFLWTITQ